MGDPKKLIKSLLEAGGYSADDSTVNSIVAHYGEDYKSMAKSLLDAGEFDYDDVKINSILGEYQLLNNPIKNIGKPTGTPNQPQQFVGYDLFSPTAPAATPQQKAQMDDIRKKKAEAREKESQEAAKVAQQYSNFGYTYLTPSAQPLIETDLEKKNRVKSENVTKLTEAKAGLNELGSVDNIIAPYDNLKSAVIPAKPTFVKKDPYEVDLFTQSLANITPQQNSQQNLIDRENHSQFQAKYSDVFESSKELISLDLNDPNWLDKFFDKQDKAVAASKGLNSLTEQIEKKFGNLVPPQYKASAELSAAAENLREEMVPLKSQIDAIDAEVERIVQQAKEQASLLTTQEEVDALTADVQRTLTEMNSNRKTLTDQYNSLLGGLDDLRTQEKANIDAFKSEVSKYNKSISSDPLLTEYYKNYDEYSKLVGELDVYRNHPQFDTFVDAYEKLDKLGKVRPEIFKSEEENKKRAELFRKINDVSAKNVEKGKVGITGTFLDPILQDLGLAFTYISNPQLAFTGNVPVVGKIGAFTNSLAQSALNIEKQALTVLAAVVDFVPGAEEVARGMRYGDYFSLQSMKQTEETLRAMTPSKFQGEFLEKQYVVKENDELAKSGILKPGTKVLLRGENNDIIGFRDEDGYILDSLMSGETYKVVKNQILKNKDSISREAGFTRGALGAVPSAVDFVLLMLGAPAATKKLVSAGLSKASAAAASTFGISTYQMFGSAYQNYLDKGLSPDKAALWALGESSAVSLVETFVSPLESKLILRGLGGEPLTKFRKLRDTTIADIASGKIGWSDGLSAMYAGLKEAGQNVLTENFEEFVQANLENTFQGLATGKYEEIPIEERINTIFATTLITALPAAGAGVSAYKDAKVDMVTTSLWHSSKNPEDFKKNLTDLVQNGNITRDKANEYMATVSYVSEELDAYADENLSKEQEVAISGLALSRRTLEDKMAQTTNKTAVEKYKEKIKEIDANIKGVVDGTKKVEVSPEVEPLINPTDDQTGLADNLGTNIEEDKPSGPVLTNDQYEEKKSRLAEIDSILNNEAQLVSAGEAPTLTEEQKSLLEKESETLTNEINQTEDAIQKQKAGEVSVQPGAETGTGMGGQVQPEPQVPTGEGEVQTQAEVQAKEQAGKEIDAFIADQVAQAEVTLALGDIDQRMTNAEYIQETELNKRADELYKIWDSVDANENLTPEQKESIKSKLETQIQKLEQYELATANKVGETVETRAVKGPRVIGTTAKKAPSKYEVTPERIAATGTTTVTDKDGKVTQGTWQALPNGTLQVVDANGNVVPVTSGYSFMETTKDNDGNVTGAVLEDTGTGKTFTVSDPEVALDMAIKAKEMALGPIEEGIFEETVQEVVVQAQPILTREGRTAQPQAPQVQAPQVQAPTVTPVQPTVERAQPVAEKAPAEPTLPATGAAQAAPAAAPEVAAEPEAKPAPEPTTEAEMSPLERMRRAFAMEEDPGKAAERVAEFLGEAGITVEIVDQSDFEDKAQQRNFSGNADGVFLVEGDTGKILLNRNKLQDQWGKTIVFHEGIHPVMNIIKNTNQELYNNILSGIRAEAKRNTEIANAVAEVEASEEYQNRGQEVVDDEIIVEVLARIASGKVKLNEVKPSIKDRIVNFLNKIASTFGIPTISKNSTDAQFKSFAGKLSKALNTGGKIGDIVGAENVKKFKADLAQQRITSKELADQTKNKTVQGELINSMQLTSNKKGEKVVNYEGKVSLEELRKFNPQMYVNRALDLLETHLVKNKTGLDEKLKKEGKLQWADGIYKEAQDTVVSNLFFIYDNIDSSVRDISQLWYDGANIIAQEMSKKYDVTLEQASAIIASQSPQKPWFDNVHLAHFVLDFYRNNQDRVFTKEDFNYYESKSKKYPAQIAYLPKLKASIGKKFSELNSYDKSVVIRAEFDQNYERKAPIRIPTGALLDTRFKSKSSFSGYDTIAKAISVIENGTAENISNNLGAFNKVRNFYNNIAAPKTDGEVTIDTHAIAASYLLPVGSTSEEVNFDPATYAFFAEAYRKAATERGVLAREMQSIVWEGVRSIFPPTDKSAKSKAIVDNLWSNYLSDKASLQETQNKIKEYGKDLSATDWSGNVNELFESDKPSTYLGELPLASGNRPTTKRGAEVAADRGVPTMGKGVGETLTQESAGIKRGAAKIEEFTVGYAPFREGNITNLSEGEKAFENARFKSWKKMSATFADELGLDITENNNTIGIYGATSDAAEASSVVTVRGTSDKVELFAALMGTMAPDIQHSVMAISYGKKGEITDNRFTFKNKKGALKFIEERGNFGANDLSFIPETNTVIILDFGDFNYNKFLKVYGKAIKQTKQVWGTARFIEEGEYSGIIQKVRSSVGGLDGPNGRTNYDSILELAQKRADRRSGNLLAQPEQKKKFLKDSVSNYLDKFAKTFGIEPITTVSPEKVKPSKSTAMAIKQAYDNLKVDNSSDPDVKAAYEQLGKEVEEQYNYLINEVGLNVIFSENDPYDNSQHMMYDVYENNRLFVFKGGEPHSFLGDQTADENGITLNEKLRAVHDYFGHAVEGNQFGKNGEEAAWVAHSKMFSPLARRGLTTETRGQNSWVNNSPENEGALKKMRDGNKMISEGNVLEGERLVEEGKNEFQFAVQKVDILPQEFVELGDYLAAPGTAQASAGIQRGGKALSSVEETTKALEGKNLQSKLNNYGVKLRDLVNLIAHNGPSIITKFDTGKIRGSSRGRYGKGFYFSNSFKNFDYGDKITFLDSKSLELLNGNKSVQSAFSSLIFPSEIKSKIYRLEEILTKVKNNREYDEISKEIDKLKKTLDSFDKNAEYIEKALRDNIKSSSSRDFASFLESLESTVIQSNNLNKMTAVEGLEDSLNNILVQSGFDGVSVDGGREIFLVPQEKLNDLLVPSQEQFISEAYHKAKKDGTNPELVNAVESLLGTAQASAGIQRAPLAPMINTPKKDVEKELWDNLKTAVKDYFIGDKTVGFFFDPKQQGEMKNEKFRAMVNAAVEYIKYKVSQGPYTRSLFLREMYSGSLTGYPVVVDAEGAAYLFKKAGVKSYNGMVERILATSDDRLPQVLKEAVETGALPKEPISDEMVTNLATEILSLADEVQDEQERVLAYEDLFHEMLESFKEKIASIGGEGFKPVFIYEIRAMRMLAQRLLDLNETQKSSEVLNTLAVIAGSSGHILRQIGLNTPDAIFIEVFGKSKNKTREAILNSQAANNEEGKTNREVIDEISAGVSQTFKETSAEVDRLKAELDKALAEIQRLKKKPKEVKEETAGTVAYYKQKANSYLESYKKTMKSLGLSSGINPQFLRAGMDYTMYLYYTFRGNMAKVKSEFFKSEELKTLRPEWDNIVGSLADEMKAADSDIVRNLILEELTKQDSDKQTRDSAKMSPAQLVARSIRTKIANLNRVASETKRPTATAQERIEKNELDIKLLNEIRQDIEAELLVVPPNRRAEVMAKVDDLLISLDNNTTKLRVASWVKAADIRKAFREEAKSLNMTVAEMIDDHFDVDRRTQSIAEEFLLRTGMTMEEAKPYIKEIEKQVNKYVTDVLGRKAQAKYFDALGFNIPKIKEEIKKVEEDIAELRDKPESPENKSKLRASAAKLNKLNDRMKAAKKKLEKMASSPQFNKMLSMIANGGLNEDTVINAFAQSLGIDTLDAKSLEHFNTLSRKIDDAKFAVDKDAAEKELKKFIYRVQNKSVYEMTLQMLEAWVYGNMLSGPPTANTALITGLIQIIQDLTVTFGQAMLKDFRYLFATGEFTNTKLYFDSVKSVFFDLKVFDTSTAVGVLMGEEGISLQQLDMDSGRLTANLAMIDKLKSMIDQVKASDKNVAAKKMAILAAGLFIQQQRLARMLVVSDYVTRSVTFPFASHRLLVEEAIDQLNMEYSTENPDGTYRKPAYIEIHKRVTEKLRKEELDAAVEAKRAEVGEGFDAERYRRSIRLDMLPQNVRESAKIYADNAAAAGDPSGYSSIAYKLLNRALNGNPLSTDPQEISPYDPELLKVWKFGKRLTRMMFKFLVATPFARIAVLGIKGVKNTLPIGMFQFRLDNNNKIKGVQFFKEQRYYDNITGDPERVIEADPVTRASRHAMAWATSITLATLFTQLFEIVPDEEEQEGFKIVEDKDPPIFITTDYDPTVEGWFKSQGVPYYVHSVYRKNDEGVLEKYLTYKDSYWGWVFRSLGTVQERLKYRVKKKGDEGAKYDNVSETDAYLMMLYGLAAFMGEYGLNDMTEKLSALMDAISTDSKSTIGNVKTSGQRFFERLPGQIAALLYPIRGFATWGQTIKGMALEENRKKGYSAFTEGTANTLGMSSFVDDEDFDDFGRPIPYTGNTYSGLRRIEEGIASIVNDRYSIMHQANFVDRITNVDRIVRKYPDLRGSIYKGSPKDALKNNFTVIEAPTDKLIIKDLKRKAGDKKNELLLNHYDYMDGLSKKELETTLKAVQRRANDYVFIDYMITILSNSSNIYNTNIDIDQLRANVTSVAKDGIGVLPEDPTAYYSRKKFMDILYANGIKIKSDGRVITDKNYSEVYNSTGLIVPVETQYDDSEETSDSWW